MAYVLEACVDSLESSLEAKLGGATRLELCQNLIIGGTTPSPALVRAVKEEAGLPVHGLLRPRFGDFLYSEKEFGLMLKEGTCLMEQGADALVSGCLTAEGELDLPRMEQLVNLAHSRGRRFTLHRAFDVCRDPFAALEQCQKLGVDTILTSGQKNSCLEGMSLLRELILRRGNVEILVGAGVDAAAIRQMKQTIPEAKSFHMSGKKVLESGMWYRKEGVSMGLPSLSEYEIWRTDGEKIREAWRELSQQ